MRTSPALLAVCLLFWTSNADAQRRGRPDPAQPAQPAQPPPQESPEDTRARAHFQLGTSYFQTGDYENALQAFQQAYELSPRPQFFFNFALVYERMGNLEQAVAYLRRYLAEAPNIAEGERPTLEARLENFTTRLQEQQARAAEERQRAEAAERERQDAARRAEEAERARRVAEREAQEGRIPLLSWISFGVGTAGLVAFAAFGALAINEAGALDEACLPGGTCSADDVSTLETYTLLADVGWITAVVGGSLGLIFLLSAGSEEEPEAATALVSPWLAPDGAGVFARGSL